VNDKLEMEFASKMISKMFNDNNLDPLSFNEMQYESGISFSC